MTCARGRRTCQKSALPSGLLLSFMRGDVDTKITRTYSRVDLVLGGAPSTLQTERGGKQIARTVEKPSTKEAGLHLGLEDSIDIVVGGNY